MVYFRPNFFEMVLQSHFGNLKLNTYFAHEEASVAARRLVQLEFARRGVRRVRRNAGGRRTVAAVIDPVAARTR